MSYGEIKKAVNSNLGKPLDVLIEEKTGAVNATGGTATAGGIFAKLNKLLTDWTTARAGKIDNIDAAISTRASQASITTLQNTANVINTATTELINGRVVKSVQMGFVEFQSKSIGVYNVSHSAVTLNKSLLIVSMSETSDTFMFPTLRTETYFSVPKSGSSNSTCYYQLYWQLVEFY